MARVLIRNIDASVLAALVSLTTLAPRAVTISRELDHPVYDCFYLALAEAREATLVTADARLLRRINRTRWSPMAMNLYG
nr:type II toxin-antitoxin system VapC family toxin [uncultured Rhodopila sp.]